MRSVFLVFRIAVAWLFCLASLSADSTRIATYNLRNYLVMDRMTEAGWRPEYPKPESEKAAVRAVILAVRPDILALQEIGPVEFLEELRADLALHGLEYPYAVHLAGSDEVRHVAVLSKLAPAEVVKHTNLDFKYLEGREVIKRGLLELAFEPEAGGTFRLFVVHLKSRWTDDNRDPESSLRRTREAEAARNTVIERTFEAGRPDFVIAGDFNDHPESAPLRRFYRRGDLRIGSRLPAADSRGEVWTHYYAKQGNYSTVDGFVLSPSLRPRARGERGTVVDLPAALEGSDHRMVYFDLQTDASVSAK